VISAEHPTLFRDGSDGAGQRFSVSVLRQTLGLSQTQSLNNLPYVLRGKLAGGLFGTMRFVDRGTLDLPNTATW